jgi:hypothetical protein
MALGSTQPLVKMSTRKISWGQRRPVREAYNLTTLVCRMSWKSGSLNLLGHTGPVTGLLYVLPFIIIIIIIIIIIYVLPFIIIIIITIITLLALQLICVCYITLRTIYNYLNFRELKNPLGLLKICFLRTTFIV